MRTRPRVAGTEIGDHRLPRGKRFDAYETPRLAVADRGREAAICGEAIVRRLRGDAPAAAPPSRIRKGDTAAGDEKAPPRSLRKRAILVVALLLALGGAGRFGWHWWAHGRFEETKRFGRAGSRS